jgi:RNA polymerase sigma-70 factor (ECF subfamily)
MTYERADGSLDVSERELVERAQRGDVDAFAQLTLSAMDRLFTTARLILRDDGLAQDAVQEALLRGWLNLRALRDPDRFGAWLHRSLVNACYRAAARRRQRRMVEIRASSVAPSPRHDIQEDAVARDQLDRGFRQLSIDQRTVLVLHHYCGFSLSETAEVIGAPVGTVQSRIHRALRAMRAALDADDRPTSLATEGT